MPNALGRGDVAGRVAAKLGAPPAAGRRALDAVLAALTDALREGHTVTLTRFGTFEVRQIGARRVRAIRAPGGAAGDRARPPPGGFRPGTELAKAVARPPRRPPAGPAGPRPRRRRRPPRAARPPGRRGGGAEPPRRTRPGGPRRRGGGAPATSLAVCVQTASANPAPRRPATRRARPRVLIRSRSRSCYASGPLGGPAAAPRTWSVAATQSVAEAPLPWPAEPQVPGRADRGVRPGRPPGPPGRADERVPHPAGSAPGRPRGGRGAPHRR